VLDLTVEELAPNSVIVRWREPDDGGSMISGYSIERRGGLHQQWQSFANVEPWRNEIQIDAETAVGGIPHLLRICAKNVVGSGPWSIEEVNTLFYQQ
jgi:Fibronectin type III domain